MLKTGFMELLKDKGLVPEVDTKVEEANAIDFFATLLEKVDAEIENGQSGYMTLLEDKGYVPVSPANDNWYEIIHSNDNDSNQRAAL